MKTYYTYMWLREDGTPYYVGKGLKKRAFVRHRVGSPPTKDRILLQEHPSEADAFAAEMFFISYYGRVDLGTGCLRNLSDGGEGPSGTIVSEETKAKLSTVHKGKPSYPRTAEIKASMSAARKGKSHGPMCDSVRSALLASRLGTVTSEQTKAKISASLKGKSGPWMGKKRPPFSAEHRAKIAASHTGKHHSAQTLVIMSAAQRNRYMTVSAPKELQCA